MINIWREHDSSRGIPVLRREVRVKRDNTVYHEHYSKAATCELYRVTQLQYLLKLYSVVVLYKLSIKFVVVCHGCLEQPIREIMPKIFKHCKILISTNISYSLSYIKY